MSFPSKVKFEWLNSWEEVWNPTFLEQWQKLIDLDPDAHVFFSPSVVRAWVETQLAFRLIKPRFLIGRQDHKLMLLFPLVLEREGWQGGWVRSLEPAGWNAFDYQNPIMSAPWADHENDVLLADILEKCRAAIGREYDVLRIPFLRASSLTRSESLPPVDEAPFLDLAEVESLDQITVKLSKGWRQDIGRQRRRLEKLGPVEMLTCGPNEGERAKGLFQKLMLFHSERWGYQRNEPAKRRIMTLWRNLATHALPSKLLHVSAIRCGDEVIACSLSFQFNNRFYFYIPASSLKWANYSPGKVHLAMLLEQAIASRIQVFDFLRGNESYKQQWTHMSVPLYRVEERVDGIGPILRTNLQQSVARLRAAAKTVVVRSRSILTPSKLVVRHVKGEKQP